MKFTLENVSKASGRLGHFIQAETGTQFKTPLVVQTTKSGSIPYISRAVYDYITKDVQVLQMSLATIDHMSESLKFFKGGFNEYVGYKHFPAILMVRDPCELVPSGYNEKDMIPLFTKRGKESLSAQKYMEMVESFKPDIYQGLCDADTNQESAKKRIQKSVDRTGEFMDYCYEQHKKSEILKSRSLFAPVVGGYCPYARAQSITHINAKGADLCGGYVFEGFHNYGRSASEVDSEKLLSIMGTCLEKLSADKPRMMPGAYTPLVTLELIRLGVDMFDTSYAYCAAVSFKALHFKYKENDTTATRNGAYLDLTDPSLYEDFSPILSDCSCLACTKHTRAYIHHLYKTNELLGPMLLMIHNLHYYMQFFEAIRASIADDKLPELITLLKLQGSDKEVDYRICEKQEEVPRKQKKKHTRQISN